MDLQKNATVPELHLNTATIKEEIDDKAKAVANVIKEHAPTLDDSDLTEEEKEYVTTFAEKIDVTDSDHVLLYGADAQKKISDFSDSAIDSIRTNDTGEVGDMLVNLISELKGFNADTEKPKGLKGLFYSAKNQIVQLQNKYDTVEENVEEIAGTLENHQATLLKDISMFDQLYDTNSSYFKELTMYIIAGEKKLNIIRETDLEELRKKAESTGDPLDAQKANDLASMCNRFEKKIHDLKLTREVSLQMAPQIRLLQNNDSLLVEKIQSTISNTLPLWKSQMVLALGLYRSEQALKAQSAVTDMTNELLKKNAAKLKTSTIATAKEAERGIIDIETLTQTNQSLIDTITEVMQIQDEGHMQRVAAEKELVNMETKLKEKLLEIKR